MSTAVPVQNALVVLCDDDGRRANLAAATLERMGYTNVAVLDGGINRWATQGSPTEWGSNVISKEFGEKMEAVHHVPEMKVTELHERIARGDKLVILDTRTLKNISAFASLADAVCPVVNSPSALLTSPKTWIKIPRSSSIVLAVPAASSAPGSCSGWASPTSTG
jgi:hypothetical protein